MYPHSYVVYCRLYINYFKFRYCSPQWRSDCQAIVLQRFGLSRFYCTTALTKFLDFWDSRYKRILIDLKVLSKPHFLLRSKLKLGCVKNRSGLQLAVHIVRGNILYEIRCKIRIDRILKSTNMEQQN